MKKKSFLWSLLGIMMFSVLSISLASCGGGDDSTTPPTQGPTGGSTSTPTGSIKVNGAESTDLTFPGEFGTGKSGIDYKLSVAVTSTVQWTMTKDADWLSVSPSNGSGTLEMTIYPTKENLTASPQTATITLSGSGVSATIKVTQESPYSNAKTTPSNILVMCYGAAFDFTCNSDVAYYDYAILRNTDIVKYSDRELAEYLKSSNISERKTPNDNWVVSTTSLVTTESKGVDYTIVTVSYNKAGEQGEVVKVPFTTKPTANAPSVYATNPGLGEDSNKNLYLIWDMEGNTYVNKYYTWTVLSNNSFLTYEKGDYLVAWWVYGEIQKNPNSHNTAINYSRNYVTSYERLEGPQLKLGAEVGNAPFNTSTQYIQIFSWATDQDNKLSGVVSNKLFTYGTNAPRRISSVRESEKVSGSAKTIKYQGMSKNDLEKNLSLLK